jgi:CRISPR-associated protein Csx17
VRTGLSWTDESRLDGCRAESLDRYLRGLGFFFVAGRLGPAVRAWWDRDAVLRVRSPGGVDGIVAALVARADRPEGWLAPLATPWRGETGRGRAFLELRNEADESLLDWFDACALPSGVARSDQRSDRRDNPLLGQGGGFGNSRPGDAFEEALAILRARASAPDELAEALRAPLMDTPLPRRLVGRFSVSKKVFGAYQSGRATGPGSSVNDARPTAQAARTNVWDAIFIFEALRAFAGATTRRPQAGLGPRASFPLLVRAKPVGLDASNDAQLRDDGDSAFELLAPLWSVAARADVVRHLIRVARVRTHRGDPARDSLEAIVAQTAGDVGGLGFDRLARFAFYAPTDPRSSVAVARGVIAARGSEASRLALQDVIVFLRQVDAALAERGESLPTGLRRARRHLDNSLARLGGRRPADVRDALIALWRFERVVGPAIPRDRFATIRAPNLDARWLALATEDKAPAARLAAAFAMRWREWPQGEQVEPGPEERSWLRRVLRDQEWDANDRVWRLTGSIATPDLERSADPLRLLVDVAVRQLVRLDPAAFRPGGDFARLDDLAWLLGLAAGPAHERMDATLAQLVASFASVRPPARTEPQGAAPESGRLIPASYGIGSTVASLLLAAQPADDERQDERRGRESTRDRLTALVARCLAGQVPAACRLALREVWRRSLFAPPALGDLPLAAANVSLGLALLGRLDVPAIRGIHDLLRSASGRPLDEAESQQEGDPDVGS